MPTEPIVTLLRRLDGANLLERYRNLVAYAARGEARPAFARALAAQTAVFDSPSEEAPHAH